MSCCLGRRVLRPLATAPFWPAEASGAAESRNAGAARSFWTWPLSRRPYSVVRPATVSAQQTVPDAIRQPEYAVTSVPSRPAQPMIQSGERDVGRMRRASQLAKSVLARGGELCKVGTTTDEIDVVLHEMVIAASAYPSPLNYRHFPKSICTSVNNVLCHGIPDSRPLEDGDIVSVDVTVYLDGVHGDTCATFAVGTVDAEAQQLISIAKECMEAGIAACGQGMAFSVIPTAIRSVLHGTPFRVSPNITGHGIGEFFHAPPVICHGASAESGVMQRGMTFTVGD